MKKTFTLFWGLCLCFGMTHAELWLEENFDYSVGNLEQTTAGTEIELNKWIVSRKTVDALGTSPQVADRTLTYSGYVNSGKGKVAVIDAAMGATSADQRISVYYMDTTTNRDTISMYAAFLFKPISAQNTSGRDFMVWDGSIGSSQTRGRLFLRKSGTNVQIGISKNSSSPIEWSSDIAVNSTNLIVFKYEAVSGGDNNDIVKVYINPTLNTGENANTSVCVTATDNTSKTDMTVKAIGLRQRGNAAEFGGLRVATTWEEALGMTADGLTLESSTPAQDAYVAPETTIFTLTFNKNITKGSGNITLTPIGNENITIAVNETTVEGKTVSIPVRLEAEKKYRLSIPAGAYLSNALSSSAIDIDFDTKNPNIYLYETFHYAPNSNIEGQGGWVVSTATADQGGKSPLVADTALTYPFYGIADADKCFALDSIAQEISGDLKRNTALPFAESGLAVDDVVYTAFMVNVAENGSTSGKEFFTYLKQGATDGANTTMRGRIQVKIEGDNKSFTIRKNSQTIETWSAASPKNETALLIVKYQNKSTSSSGDADLFTLFVNPDLSKTETENENVKIDAIGNDADGGSDLRYIAFRQMKIMAKIGGIRITKTWKDAANYNPNMFLPTIKNNPLSVYAGNGQIIYTETEAGTLTITDMTGKTIKSVSVNAPICITVPQQGVYIVHLTTTKGETKTAKLCIK